MKILALADVESEYYYNFYTPGKLDDFDLILSCGDLPKSYLEFFVTLSNCPLLYVRGNHDDTFGENPPEGCECVEDRIFVQNGIRILGLGGSFRYREGDNMYTEFQMELRIRRLWLQLRKYRGFDILLTHAPARYINDFDSMSHRGFVCFRKLLERYRPRYFLHGHIHRTYGVHIPRQSRFEDTTVINAFEHFAFEY
ncbi:MAG: metallophosphoesterase [Oscillibacter sp.]|nr:metallophosphoesterase [Oscillibacter sp.]MBQ9617981.1 metallophosphoesterase [Oscillibacter sp.]